MENDLQRLNDIMKPYFDKKQEIESNNNRLLDEKSESKEKIQNLKNERIEHRKELERQLEELPKKFKLYIEDLEEKRNAEIDKYVTETLNSSSNFYEGYGSSVRRDLEKEYNKIIEAAKSDFKAQEEQLLQEIKALKSRQDDEKLEIANLETLKNTPNFRNVDLRELVEAKWSVRKDLFAYKKELELKLQQEEINFKQAMLNLSSFKYEYDDKRRPINGEDWKKLYEESNIISDRIQKLRELLSKVEEYQELTIGTPEENAAQIRSLTPWEKAEYDRRKALENKEKKLKITEIEPEKTEPEKTEPEKTEPEKTEPEKTEPEFKKPTDNPDLVESLDTVRKPDFVFADDDIVVDTTSDLLSLVFNEIMDEVENMRSVKVNASKGELGKTEGYISTKDGLESEYNLSNTTLSLADEGDLRLPNGEYLNSEDFDKALEAYQNKNKGYTYVVRETGKKYSPTDRSLKKFKEKLKKCSTLKLIRENKLSKLDVINVFGKGRDESDFRESQLGTLYGRENMPEGDYISKKELVVSLTSFLSRKKIDWLKKFSEKLKQKIKYRKNQKEEPAYGEPKDQEYIDKDQYDESDIWIDEDFNIKSK